jgi:hypothetical protein
MGNLYLHFELPFCKFVCTKFKLDSISVLVFGVKVKGAMLGYFFLPGGRGLAVPCAFNPLSV